MLGCASVCHREMCHNVQTCVTGQLRRPCRARRWPTVQPALISFWKVAATAVEKL